MATLFSSLATLAYWGLSVYEWIVIIAILVSWVHPDPGNPIIRFLHRMTQPLWDYLAERLPPALRLFSAYCSLLLVWFLKIFVPGTFQVLAVFSADQIGPVDVPARVAGYFLLGLGIVVQNLLFFMILLLLIWFFMTLVNPAVNNPIVRTVYILVDPLITPFQRRLPRMRIDISPLLAAGIFLLCNVFLVSQLIAYSAGLAHYSRGTLPISPSRSAAHSPGEYSTKFAHFRTPTAAPGGSPGDRWPIIFTLA